MNPNLKRVLAVFAGIVLGFFIVFAWEAIGYRLFPPPPGINLDQLTPEQMMQALPFGAKLWVVAGWGVATLAGSLLAARISGVATSGWIVGVFFLISTVANLFSLPHPAWMWIAGIALPMPIAWMGGKLGAKK